MAIFLVLFVLVAAISQLSFIQSIDNSIVTAVDWPDLSLLLYPFNFWVSLIWIGVISFLIYKKYGEKIFALYLGIFFSTLFIEIFLKLSFPTPELSSHSVGGLEAAGTFPSGHVLRATLVAGGLRLLGAPKMIWLLPVIEAVAMIASKGHWPTDLLGGWLLGMAGIAAIYKLLDSNPRNKEQS